MTPFTRNLHRLAVGVHLVGLSLFVWMYALEPNWAWAALGGWSIYYGARSLSALRKFGRNRGGK